MSFLIALAAFVAIISVYSTLVTVIVQGLHKIFGLRSAGMNETLRAFYTDTLARIQPSNTPDTEKVQAAGPGKGPSAAAKAFADKITRSEPARSPRFWYIRSWPVIGRLFADKRKSLTALEFIESIAETPEGAALRHYSRPDLRKALHAAAYQFERLSDIQFSYFRSRANMISVIVGISIAVFVNFDAIAVYKELSSNTTLSSRVTLALDKERVDLLRQMATDEPAEVATTAGMSSDWTSLAGDVRSLGVPIGRKMFPHCEGYEPSSAGTGRDGLFYDARCAAPNQQPVNAVWKNSFGEYLVEEKVTYTGPVAQTGHWFAYRLERVAAISHNVQTFLLWLLGILVAGGLMGLGAPFWFKVFSRLSTIVMPAARATLIAAEAGHARVSSTGPEQRQTVRDAESGRIDDLEEGYVAVLTSQMDGLISPDSTSSQLGTLEEAEPGRQIGTRPAAPGRVI